MWTEGLFVIDTKQDSFAFRLHDAATLEKSENTRHPDFLKVSQGITIALFRPDGTDRVTQAFQQHEYNKSVPKESTIGNATFACNVPGREALLRGHAYTTPSEGHTEGKPGPVVAPSPTVMTLTLTLNKDDKVLTVASCSSEKELCGNVVKEVPAGTWYHPVYHVPDAMSHPRNMVEALDLLEMMPSSYEGISKLKEIVAAHSHLIEKSRTGADNTPLEPFIVVEGMDATGKSTLVSNLAKSLGAYELNCPPPIMAEIRPLFDDKYPQLVRRTYYALGNYIMGLQVAEMRKEKPVVMDRYWHSTAVYSIASECRHGDDTVLPPAGHWVYEWPDDIHRPSFAIYLTVDEKTRNERLMQRLRATELDSTADEKWLAQDEHLRKRISTGYERMSGCSVTVVDASGTREEVLLRTLNVFNQHKIV